MTFVQMHMVLLQDIIYFIIRYKPYMCKNSFAKCVQYICTHFLRTSSVLLGYYLTVIYFFIYCITSLLNKLFMTNCTCQFAMPCSEKKFQDFHAELSNSTLSVKYRRVIEFLPFVLILLILLQKFKLMYFCSQLSFQMLSTQFLTDKWPIFPS